MPARLSSSGAGTRRGAIHATARIAAANARRRLLTDGDLSAHATTPRRAVVEAFDLHRWHAVVAAVRRLDAVDEALRLIAHRPVEDDPVLAHVHVAGRPLLVALAERAALGERIRGQVDLEAAGQEIHQRHLAHDVVGRADEQHDVQLGGDRALRDLLAVGAAELTRHLEAVGDLLGLGLTVESRLHELVEEGLSARRAEADLRGAVRYGRAQPDAASGGERLRRTIP